MNDSTENPTASEPSSNFQISFREDLPGPECEVAQHSVATLMARAEERFARFRSIAAEQAHSFPGNTYIKLDRPVNSLNHFEQGDILRFSG